MNKALEFLKECGTFYLATNKGTNQKSDHLVLYLNMKKNYILSQAIEKSVLNKC